MMTTPYSRKPAISTLPLVLTLILGIGLPGLSCPKEPAAGAPPAKKVAKAPVLDRDTLLAGLEKTNRRVLLLAARRGYTELAARLLKAGVDVNGAISDRLARSVRPAAECTDTESKILATLKLEKKGSPLLGGSWEIRLAV